MIRQLAALTASVVLVGFNATPALADSESLTRAFLEDDYELVYRRENLPAAVVESIGPIDNPDEEFNATDIIYDHTVPRRQIILAGLGEQLTFVLYAQGGRGLHNEVALFRPTGASALEMCVYSHSSLIGDLPALRDNFSTAESMPYLVECRLTTRSSAEDP